MDVQYIGKAGRVESRPIRLYIPQSAGQPMPLVYVPHYEMTADSLELRRYLEKGWAVASPAWVKSAYNGLLTDDDLVFNCAALYTLKHMGTFDTQRIALVGGSAGGYTTLMLNALQMGHCASVAKSPIANVYFNFYQYFDLARRSDALFFLRLVRDSFRPVLENFPNPADTDRWEAFSLVGLADCLGSPVMITHATSDVLVPVDQITRAFTHAAEGSSMPEGYSTRLPEDNPGVLGRSLVDELPGEQTRVERILMDKPDEAPALPFDPDRLFQIIIFDDGPTEAYGSHSIAPGTNLCDDTPYLEAMFARGLGQNETLTGGKLRLLFERYNGESVQLPAHEGVNDAVYGSLAVYRREIVEGLGVWAADHSAEALEAAVMEAAAAMEDARSRDSFLETWESIRRELNIELLDKRPAVLDGVNGGRQYLHEHGQLNDHIGQAGIHQRLFHRQLLLMMGHIGQQGMQHRVIDEGDVPHVLCNFNQLRADGVLVRIRRIADEIDGVDAFHCLGCRFARIQVADKDFLRSGCAHRFLAARTVNPGAGVRASGIDHHPHILGELEDRADSVPVVIQAPIIGGMEPYPPAEGEAMP